MPLFAHLTEAEIQRYVAGARSLQTEQHARVCSWCMDRLVETAMRRVFWERRGPLQRLVKIDPAREIDRLLAQIEADGRRDAA